jgi:tetratricopeptide (TPR) repeat protein
MARVEAPFSLTILNDLGWVAYLAQRYDRAREINTQAIEMDAKFWPAYRDLGLALEKLGRFPEAIAQMKKAVELDSSHSPSNLEMLGGAYVAAGQVDAARKVLAELTADSTTRYVCPYEVATVYACLGEPDAAMKWLNDSYDQKADCLPWAATDVKLDSLRGDKRFQDLMKKMGLETRTARVPKVP